MNLTAFPHSPYAAELRRGRATLRFSPKLEAEYARAHLINSRTLIRLVCVVATLLALMQGAEQILTEASTSIGLIDLALMVGGTIVLTAIAWSEAFERLFLPWAKVIVPLRNALVAIHVAAAAARGQVEMLMILPLALVGPFFFLGFDFRTALLCTTSTAVSFVAAAVLADLAPPVALHACLFLLVNLVALAIAARYLEKSSRTSFLHTHAIAELAQHDALTGAKNRGVFDEHLAQLWMRAVQERRAIAILLIDVDHFKAYNDRYGRQAGDEALRRIAQALQSVCRPNDVLARYGGEEFAAALYDVHNHQAAGVAERMRVAVENLNMEHAAGACGRVTISAGVAAVEPTAERSSDGALQLADQALYEAKLKGRNRIELMNDTEHSMLVTGVFSTTQRAGNE